MSNKILGQDNEFNRLPGEDGGTAFPQSGVVKLSGTLETSSSLLGGSGMSLRDYFAAKAMQGTIRRWDGYPFGGGQNSPQYKELAEEAYLIADAMVEERNK